MTNPVIDSLLRLILIKNYYLKKTNDNYDNHLMDYIVEFNRFKKKKKDLYDKNIFIEKNNKKKKKDLYDKNIFIEKNNNVDELFKVYF